jgi:hypothetical protein
MSDVIVKTINWTLAHIAVLESHELDDRSVPGYILRISQTQSIF